MASTRLLRLLPVLFLGACPSKNSGGDGAADRTAGTDQPSVHDQHGNVDGNARSEASLKPDGLKPDGLKPDAPVATPQDIDILFMIDNSNSMEPKQANLASNFPKLIEALRSPKLGPVGPGVPCSASNPGGCKLPNLHIGVISSDLGAGTYSFESCETPGGDGGKLHSGPGKLAPLGCPTPKDAWILYQDAAGGAVTNVQNATSIDPVEQVKQAFSCIAYLGPGGCGFEHQLESAHKALTPGTNPGFLRQSRSARSLHSAAPASAWSATSP